MATLDYTPVLLSSLKDLRELRLAANTIYVGPLPRELKEEHYQTLQEFISKYTLPALTLGDSKFNADNSKLVNLNPKSVDELREAYKLLINNMNALINHIEKSIPSHYDEHLEKVNDLQAKLDQETNKKQEVINESNKLKDELLYKARTLDHTENELKQESIKATNLLQSINLLKSSSETKERLLLDKNTALEAENTKLKDKKQKEQVVANSQEFRNQARVSRVNASIFLEAIVLALSGFIYFLFHLLSNDYELFNVATGIIEKSKKIDAKIYSQLITVEIIKRLGTKLLIFSTIIYGITFLVKNYNAQMHNYIANSHKANALLSTVNLIGTAREDEGNDKIILQATQAIFTTQKSGYQGAENEPTSPNLITNVIDAVTKKANKPFEVSGSL